MHSLPHVLDGSLTHMMDETPYLEWDELSLDWEYRIDWGRRMLHVYGSASGKMSVSFDRVDVKWMEGCQNANNVFDP